MIDAHIHVWTDDQSRYHRLPSSPDYPPRRFTPDHFLQEVIPHGVRRAVLIQMSFYGFDNSYMLDAMRSHPGVFAGVAQIDPVSAELRSRIQSLKIQGVRGFRIVGIHTAQSWPDDPAMRQLWKHAAEESMAICPLINPDAIPVVDRMCELYPDTRVVIDHFARIGATGSIAEEDVQALCSLARHQNVFVKLSAFYALGRKTAPYHDLIPLIRRVFDAFGPSRLMWGSDSPFQVENPHTYSASISLISDLDFATPAEKELLLRGTADSVFFISC